MRPKSAPSKGPRSSREANALGFAKRQSRKAAEAGSDVYEYSSGKNKRASITLSLDKDEALGARADEGDVELDRDALQARIMNTEEGGDGAVNSGDDEEIESDDAFEASDEDRFAGFSFAKKPKPQQRKPSKSSSRPTVRFTDVNLDEDESESQAANDVEHGADDEEIDGDSDEFLDVLDVLDGRGEPDFGDDKEAEGGARGKSAQGADGADDDENDEEDLDEDDEDDESEDDPGDDDMADVFAPSDTDQDGEALDQLNAFVAQLAPGTKRKAGSEPQDVRGGAPPPPKRRMLNARTEAGVEGEFGVHAAAGSKLRLEDLLAPLASASASLQALAKSTKPLAKGAALPAPLPQRTQDRLDREAAYEQTTAEVDKWTATMKRIKEAEHLSFPLQVPQKAHPSTAALAAKFKPSTQLESAVDRLLRAAQMRDEGDIAKTEELKLNHLSVAEVAERRGELRKMRELMFRAEAKAKRVAKIKSKTYRKIQRKGRERIKGLIKEADGDADGEADGEARLKREVERARERATLRHKNTGKWAKAMKARGELEGDQRREIEEMLEKGERLRTKIRGDGSENDDDDDDDDAADGVEGIKASAFEELRRLERDGAADAPNQGKGVFGMKFMQDAMAREQRRVDEAADGFRAEMTQMEDGSDGDGPHEPDAAAAGDVQVQRTGGRIAFRPGHPTVPPWPVAPSESSSTLKSSEPALLSPVVASHAAARSSPPAPAPPDDVASAPSPHPEPGAGDPAPNPWLRPRGAAATQSRKKNEVLIGKDSAGAVKSKNQMRKRLLKGDAAREQAREDAVVEISLDAVLTLAGASNSREGPGETPTAAKGKATAWASGQQVDAAFEDSDENSEVEAQEHRVQTKGKVNGVKAFEQRDLVALAFAGDNVVQDFEKEKRREIDADAPREEDHTLPGWGSWGGAGTRRNPKAKKIVKRIAGIEPAARADHGKPHLIISEKKEKKAGKYLTKELPYPYTSKAQFEKSMEVPIGTEWNTRVGFQRQTLPRVVKKMGTVIDPLEKMF